MRTQLCAEDGTHDSSRCVASRQSALLLYQHGLGSALANANREGEDNRREERLRIWGYA